MTLRRLWGPAGVFSLVMAVGCTGTNPTNNTTSSSGGGSSGTGGGSSGVVSGGGSSGNTGGSSNAGGSSNGGSSNGASSNAGGSSNGGSSNAGGSSNGGGSSAGGSSNGGGSSNAGGSSGGVSSSGAASSSSNGGPVQQELEQAGARTNDDEAGAETLPVGGNVDGVVDDPATLGADFDVYGVTAAAGDILRITLDARGSSLTPAFLVSMPDQTGRESPVAPAAGGSVSREVYVSEAGQVAVIVTDEINAVGGGEAGGADFTYRLTVDRVTRSPSAVTVPGVQSGNWTGVALYSFTATAGQPIVAETCARRLSPPTALDTIAYIMTGASPPVRIDLSDDINGQIVDSSATQAAGMVVAGPTVVVVDAYGFDGTPAYTVHIRQDTVMIQCVSGGGSSSGPVGSSSAGNSSSGPTVSSSSGPPSSSGNASSMGGITGAGTLWFRGDVITNNVNQLFRYDPQTGIRTLLDVAAGATNTLAEASAYAVTPDGNRVLVSTDRDVAGVFDLWAFNRDGTAPQKLTNMPATADVFEMVVSPDGTRVAYRADADVDNADDIYVVPVNGSAQPTRLTARNVAAPVPADLDAVFLNNTRGFSFSRDGRYVAVSADWEENGRVQLFVFDLMGGTPAASTITPLASLQAAPAMGNTGVVGTPEWTAGGRVLFKATTAADTTFKLYHANPNGTGLALLPNGPTGTQQIGSFGVSPNGTSVALNMDSAATPGAYNVYVMPSDGSAAPTVLTTNTLVGGGADLFSRIEWSPNGATLGFTADFTTNNVFEPYVVAVAGGSMPIKLATMPATGSANNMTFAINSTVVAYRADPDVNNDQKLYLVNLAVQPVIPQLVQDITVLNGDVYGESVFAP